MITLITIINIITPIFIFAIFLILVSLKPDTTQAISREYGNSLGGKIGEWKLQHYTTVWVAYIGAMRG